MRSRCVEALWCAGWTFCLWGMIARPPVARADDLSWTLYYSETGANAGVFELFVSGDASAHAGLAAYGVQLGGGIDALDHRSPNGLGESVNGVGAIAFGGFARSPDGEPWLTATQDTITGTGFLLAMVVTFLGSLNREP